MRPMKEISTTIAAKRLRKGHAEKECAVRPNAKSLAFLKLFARNYQVDHRLPEGLQGLFVG